MKVNKRNSGGGRDTEPAIYICSDLMNLNAEARDLLNNPSFISVELECNILILKNGTKDDFKVVRAEKHIHGISASMFQRGTLAKIPNRTKIFGVFKDGRLEFEIPKEYITYKCNNE